MSGRYRFAVRFRLDPEGVAVSPAEFETTMSRPADPPGEDGWLFFRDNLWHGELSDGAHARDLASEALGVEVVDVEFRAFETDRDSYEALKEAIAADLPEFRADDVPEVLHKYFGSAVEVRPDEA
ncbi:MAG: LWR-salt protein [Halobacteriaceae archaeon]